MVQLMRSPFRRRNLALFALVWLWPILAFGQAPGKPTNVGVNARAAQPTITSLSPNAGALGSTVTISGSGFAATQGSGTVTFNGVAAAASAWSSLSITVTVPAGATTGPVVVSQNGLTSAGVTFTVSSGSLSCNRSATGLDNTTVQTFLTNATTAGTAGAPYIYCLPAGTGHWTGQVTWLAPAYTMLLGAGSLSTTGGGDATIIIDDWAGTQPLFFIGGGTVGATFRVAGMTMRGGTGDATKDFIGIGGFSLFQRVDHLHCDSTTYAGDPYFGSTCIAWFGLPTIAGVVDHVIVDLQGASNGIRFFGTGNGDVTFNDPTALGTQSGWVYVEDSIIRTDGTNSGTGHQGGAANDCQQAGNFVFRYNTFTGSGLQTHSTGSGGGRTRGCRKWEIYGNTYDSIATVSASTPEGDRRLTVFYATSGSGVVWGNTISSATSYKTLVELHSNRRDNSTYSFAAPPNGYGYCGTDSGLSGAGTNWDQNTFTTTGYHCLDQPGMGRGDLLNGDFPNLTNLTTGCIYNQACAYPRQDVEPTREWLNTLAGLSPFSIINGSFVDNVDRFTYLGVSFDGTAGIGSGTRGARPTSTTNGVAYWSTDQGGNWNTSNGSANDGCLDVVMSGAWSNCAYTPLQYPHPLVN